MPGTSDEAPSVDAANHVLVEQQDGTLVLYVNNEVQQNTSNADDTTVVMLHCCFDL